MAAYNKFETFTGDLGLKVHDLNADTFKVYLSNTAPSASLDSIKADLAEIAAGNGYTAGGEDVLNTYSEVTGTGTMGGTDIVWTASAGTIGPFRYAILYNDTPITPADPLVSWWDNGSAITLNDGESFTFDITTNLFTLT